MSAFQSKLPFIPTDDAISTSGQLDIGYVVRPFITQDNGIAVSSKLTPHEIAAIPNPQEFSAGPDILGRGHIIKAPNSAIFVPTIFAPFLPTLQMAVNIEHAIKGEAAFAKSWVTMRVSRHTSDNGFAHQPDFGQMHDHAYNGSSSYYVAADHMGTIFPTFTSREFFLTRFEEKDRHQSPTTNQRRTFILVNFFHQKMPDERNRLGLHRYSYDGGTPQRADEWHAAAQNIIHPAYPAAAQARDIAAWRERHSAKPAQQNG